LTFALKELEIDPANQLLEPITAFFEWADIIDNKILGQALRDNLLSKWIATLQEWLLILDTLAVENLHDFDDALDEILKWY
jgi:hypothetical protein